MRRGDHDGRHTHGIIETSVFQGLRHDAGKPDVQAIAAMVLRDRKQNRVFGMGRAGGATTFVLHGVFQLDMAVFSEAQHEAGRGLEIKGRNQAKPGDEEGLEVMR